MQFSVGSVDEFFVGACGEGDPLGAERGIGADVPDRKADDGVGAGLEGFDVVGCMIGDEVLYNCQRFR